MRGPRAVWLVGMMGAGKSTVGLALAARLDCPFIDTDLEIERRAGRRIREIFAEQGEAVFRELEADEVARARDRAAVVALGGGAVERPDAVDRLSETGEVAYLRAKPSTLLERVAEAEDRPLLAGLDAPGRLAALTELLERRSSAYERATIVVDVDERSVEAVVARIEAAIDVCRAASEEEVG